MSHAMGDWHGVETTPSRLLHSRSSGQAVAVLAGLVLVFAAAMKWEQLPVVERMGHGLLYRRGFVLLQILVECALAGWLISGLLPRWSRQVAAVCLATFSLVALYKAIGGAESCGCFGLLKVNPWVTFGVDVVLAGLLTWSAGSGLIRSPYMHSGGEGIDGGDDLRAWGVSGRRPIGRAGLLGLGMLAVLGLSLWRVQVQARPGGDGIIFGNGNLVILEPGKWIDGPLRLLSDVRPESITQRLSKGRWTLVLYHSDCGACRRAVPLYQRWAHERRKQLCLVEIPPYAPPGQGLARQDDLALSARLHDDHEWFVTTPVALLLQDGNVAAAAIGKDAENPPWE